MKNLHSQEEFGGKATNLQILIDKGYPVPDSIFIPVTEFEEYQKTGVVPESLIKSVLELGEGEVAVRSSANVEDGGKTSFAGQFKTLFVPNSYETVENAIIDCFESVKDENVSRYALSHQIDPDSIKLGLVVQPVVDSKYAGVLFTQDPHDPKAHIGLINYVEGNGDPLVSGLSTGVEISFSRNGNQTAESPFNLETLVELGMEIENDYGAPQDIEFAIDQQNNPIILQSRPITAYQFETQDVIDFEIEKTNVQIPNGSVFTQSNIAELFPEPTNMGFGIFTYIFTGNELVDGAIQLGRNQMGYDCDVPDKKSPIFSLIAGRPFFNIATDSFTFRPKGMSFADYEQGFTGEYIKRVKEDPTLADYPEGGLYMQNPSLDTLIEKFGLDKGKQYAKVYEQFMNTIDENLLQVKHDLQAGFNQTQAYVDKMNSKNIENMSEHQLYESLDDTLEILRTHSCVDFVKAARLGFFSFDRVRNEIINNNPDGDVDQITNLIIGATHAQYKNKTSEIQQALQTKPYEYFLTEFGHMGQLEISLPRYKEMDESHFNKGSKTSQPSDKSSTDAMNFEEICAKYGLKDNESLRTHAQDAADYFALRETAKCEYLKPLSIVKDLLKQIGKNTELGDDIYLLTPSELLNKNINLGKMQDSIHREKAFANAYKTIKVNSPFISKNDMYSNVSNGHHANALAGKQIVPGIAEGNVLKAKTSTEYLHMMGEVNLPAIGVFPSTDPSYGSLDGLSGVVTKYGGKLSHTATIAREKNIPYITGVNIDDIPKDGYIKIGEGKITFDN